MAVVLIVDDSSAGRNLDFSPSRFQSGIAAAQLLGFLHLADKANVCVMSLSKPQTGVSPFVHDQDRLKHQLSLLSLADDCDGGGPAYDVALGVASLLLQRRRRERKAPQERARVVLLAGSLICQDLDPVRRELRRADIQVDIVSYGDLAENRKALAGFGSSVWEIPKTHFSVAHVLLDLPVVQKRALNPYQLWQQAFGSANNANKSEKETSEQEREEEEKRAAALAEKNALAFVPHFSEIRTGHEISQHGSMVLRLDLVRGGERTTVKLDASQLIADATDLDELGNVSLVLRNGRLTVLLKLFSVAAGKSQLRPFGGISHRRNAVISDPRKGSLSICVTSSGAKHVMWSDEASGAVEDDIVVNSDFVFECVKEEASVFQLHNKAARSRPGQSELSDFFHNGRPRNMPSDKMGDFRALYWLQCATDTSASVTEQLNNVVAGVQGARPLLAKMDAFVNDHLSEQIIQEFGAKPHADKEEGTPPPSFEAPRKLCSKCNATTHFAWQCRTTK